MVELQVQHMEKKTPEEALKEIKEIATKGCIVWGDDTITSQYNDEVQEIFYVLRVHLTGKVPKRPIWVGDGYNIGICLDEENGVYSDKSLEAINLVNKTLGLNITTSTIWEDAAAELRSNRKRNHN